MQWKGEEPPQATDDEALAIQAWNHLSNGMGGFDWAGLPTVVHLLGITDIEMLLHRLNTIKAHRPPKDHPGAPD